MPPSLVASLGHSADRHSTCATEAIASAFSRALGNWSASVSGGHATGLTQKATPWSSVALCRIVPTDMTAKIGGCFLRWGARTGATHPVAGDALIEACMHAEHAHDNEARNDSSST